MGTTRVCLYTRASIDEENQLGIERFAQRVSALDSRLDTLRDQDSQLGQDLAAHAPMMPDTQELAAVAQHLDQIIASGNAQQTKGL